MADGTDMESRELNELTRRIIGAAIEVHRRLGPGLLEKTYQICLACELRYLGLKVRREVPVRVVYRDQVISHAYRIDLLVGEKVVVEIKVAKAFHPVDVSQVLTYLRLSDLHVGLLLNYNVDTLTAGGVKRIVRGGAVHRPSELSR